MAAPRALILTGERGSGKTTLCLALAARSPRYRGLVSPSLLDETGSRIGFAARCLATREQWVLARSDAELDGPRFGRFSFSSAGIARAVGCLRGALASRAQQGGRGPCAGNAAPPVARNGPLLPPVAVVDEIGPLEIERGQGLAPVLPLLAAAGHLLLVVRPSFVARVEALVPAHECSLIVVTPANRASLAAAIDGSFV